MAIGLGKMMGFQFIDNFNNPYNSASITEFWRRWHMSLITWITDYLYTPFSFGLRKFKLLGIVLALMITFLIAGIWHGAAFTFITWGILSSHLINKKNIEINQEKEIKEKEKD